MSQQITFNRHLLLLIAIHVFFTAACQQNNTTPDKEMSKLSVIDMPEYRNKYMEPMSYETHVFDLYGNKTQLRLDDIMKIENAHRDKNTPDGPIWFSYRDTSNKVWFAKQGSMHVLAHVDAYDLAYKKELRRKSEKFFHDLFGTIAGIVSILTAFIILKKWRLNRLNIPLRKLPLYNGIKIKKIVPFEKVMTSHAGHYLTGEVSSGSRFVNITRHEIYDTHLFEAWELTIKNSGPTHYDKVDIYINNRTPFVFYNLQPGTSAKAIMDAGEEKEFKFRGIIATTGQPKESIKLPIKYEPIKFSRNRLFFLYYILLLLIAYLFAKDFKSLNDFGLLGLAAIVLIPLFGLRKHHTTSGLIFIVMIVAIYNEFYPAALVCSIYLGLNWQRKKSLLTYYQTYPKV